MLALGSLIAGIAKVAFGIGSGVFLTPVLALVLDPKMVIGIMTPLMLVTDISALHHHRGKWNTGHMLVLIPTSLVGIAAGALFLAWAPSVVVRKAIGVIALLYVAMQLIRARRNGVKTVALVPRWVGWVAGFVGGIITTVAHSGGVFLSIYLLGVGLAKNTFVATLVAMLFVFDLVKLPLYWQTGILTLPIMLTGLAMTPVMLFGGQLGMWINRRMTVEQFSRMILGIVAISGVLLVAR